MQWLFYFTLEEFFGNCLEKRWCKEKSLKHSSYWWNIIEQADIKFWNKKKDKSEFICELLPPACMSSYANSFSTSLLICKMRMILCMPQLDRESEVRKYMKVPSTKQSLVGFWVLLSKNYHLVCIEQSQSNAKRENTADGNMETVDIVNG